MRNLKKILALVLALVMSLSLMATASAADFEDVKDDTNYKTAIDVLSGLGVFNGYKEDGTFRPDGEITRAETAAIIYRIVTGDVKDEQVAIYRDYGLFSDVKPDSWYAGYVNFCANAEYIKGDGKGHFNPNDKVEGYAALAMILRAIGYTANGGFTGSDWRTQTARVGEARKITKNITSGTLGANADRKTVAEILYQAIMVDMVDHNVDKTFNGEQGYFTIPQTLGQKTFGLEKVTGVILANEWANLVGTKVLAADTTLMQVTGTSATQTKLAVDKDGNLPTLTLNDKTELEMQEALDAVGLTYVAHIANPTATTADVITLDESDINVVAYNEGKGVYKAVEHQLMNNSTWDTIEDLAETQGLSLDKDSQYFINYADEWDDDCQSEYRISYAIAKDSLNTNDGLASVNNKDTWKAYIEELKKATNNGTIPTPANSKYPGHYLGERTIKLDLNLDGTAETSVDCWVVAIIPENTINQIDLDIMREIFYTADRIGNNGTNTSEWLSNYAVGEVYVGTTSMQDYSDTMSWNEFKAKYFTIDVNSRKFEQCEIGNSLRIIDNDADGVAEYVLRIDYTQDKIIGTVKSQPAGYSVAIGSYEGNLLYNPQADDIAQGTVINYTEIDKKLYVWPAPVVTDTITNKNYEKITVTASNEETYNQSGITNRTQLDENIMLMNQGAKYNMYMDVYGVNIRSYELAQGTKYALLTEMYPTTDRNGNYVFDRGAIAEVKIGEADVTEYPVVLDTNNNSLNLFFNPSIWTWSNRAYHGVNAGGVNPVMPGAQIYNANYLQPAVAHLGIGATKASTPVSIGSTNNEVEYNQADWYRSVSKMQTIADPANGTGGTYGVFDYNGKNAPDGIDKSFSFTNVASYIDNDGTLTLDTASKLSTDRATGAQIYRVGSAAATESGIAPFFHGTEAELLAEYDRVNNITSAADTRAETWFAKYIGNADTPATAASYRNGTGIYPVYSEDYVQLDLTKADMGQALKADDLVVKAGIRHFHIDDDYDTLYNTNANEYVDATIDTEFYIVMPGTTKNILYKVGYADLPSIKVSEIRAAYAVAHNTRDDKDGLDYWVADVIVIETNKLTYDYDSISLVYYNPYVQSGYTRYANTLNNEWFNLQPDYEGKALMGIMPKDVEWSNANLGWGDWSWSATDKSNYNFWKLYQTELVSPGNLNVTSAEKITKDFNNFGIYAGVATRIEDLQTSEYVDVTTQNTGCVQTYAIDVGYGTGNEVPFYRISSTDQYYGTIYTATQLNLNQSLRYSDVKDGDQLIWVYNKAQNRIAFVIDLGVRVKGQNGSTINYTAPNWLMSLADNTGLYNRILIDQNTVPPTPEKEFTVSFASKTAVGALTAGQVVKSVKADKNENVLVPMADLVKVGYTLGTVQINGVNVPNDGTNYVIANVQGNTTVDVTYTVDQKTLVVTADNTVSAGDATAIKVDNAAVPANMQVGQTFEVTFTGVENFSYSYTVNSGTPVPVTMDGLTGKFQVTMPNANTTILITDTARPEVAVATAAAANTTVTFTQAAADAAVGATATALTTAAGGNTFTDAVVSFTVAVTPGQNVELDKVYYQTIASNGPQEITAVEGVYTVPADVVAAGNDITISTTTTSTAPYTVTLALGATAAAPTSDVEYSLDGGTTWTTVTAGDVNVSRASGTIMFRSMDEFTVAATTFTAAPTIDPTAGGFSVTVSGITENGTLTVSKK